MALNEQYIARIPTMMDRLPDLLELTKNSYNIFLQPEIESDKRRNQGLQSLLIEIFGDVETGEGLTNSNGTLMLQYVSTNSNKPEETGYKLGNPRYNIEECLLKDQTYAIPLKAYFRLVQKQESGKQKELITQEVNLCELPLMTDSASFIINGAERIIVSQLHRSPGVIFEEDEEKRLSVYGKRLYIARMIPYRGAWVEFEFDVNNVLYVRLDRKRKFYATILLRALGLEKDEDIIATFCEIEEHKLSTLTAESLTDRIIAKDIINKKTGEVILEANERISSEQVKQKYDQLKQAEIETIFLIKEFGKGDPIHETLLKDKEDRDYRNDRSIKTQAAEKIHGFQRASEFMPKEQALLYLENLLLKPRRYDLGIVGRYKINKKLADLYREYEKHKDFTWWETPSARRRVITLADIVVTIKYLLDLSKNIGDRGIDDIDHLGNRRIRAVGELLENQLRIGLLQMARLCRDKMNSPVLEKLTPKQLLNPAPLIAMVRKFFGTSQLSQFMDQTNPLAELTHKRRLSALGPGGLHRKRAGFEVRDVHPTHYGRICPIETPEGPNIGLISSLACFARVNEYGLIETPYRTVNGSVVENKIEYLTADREDEYFIAQANEPLDEKNKFVSDTVNSRHRGDFPIKESTDVNFMDISPMQVVGISAALIPFLEHDDVNRALMGSNMQRQAISPILREPPLIATGIEDRVAHDSRAILVARHPGQVIWCSADEIIVYTDKNELDIYRLTKYRRSNQDTCIDQITIIKKGDRVRTGDVLVDGPCTAQGKLSLGRNLLVCFMPWEGYNFEDAILVSDKLVREDVFTSIHIREFEAEARDTKLGPEEITRDIPNVSAEDLLNLDEQGIIREGTEVKPGDILVGKVAPKGEQQVTPEERLLRVIFGKKAEDVQDVSLRVPPGVEGKVVGVKVLSRQDKLSKKDKEKFRSEIKKIKEDKLAELKESELIVKVDEKFRLDELTAAQAKEQKTQIHTLYDYWRKEIIKTMEQELKQLTSGDDLPITVNKIVKVYITTRRKIQVGDKIAGRHGNKGVVARILPKEDMPFLPDGTPIDVILSPLSVPSRMNLGQLFETMLGWAANALNIQLITPVFAGPKEDTTVAKIREAKDYLRKLGVKEEYLPDDDCRITLYDGRTGEPFQEKVLYGSMYLMKLLHMVEDKIHARATGPYSLVTRQPLGGKAQFGGQRFGEMEVWALEGYGASHLLQEFLTVKSDDVLGRTKVYESIIRGESVSHRGVPESFKVLVHELQAIGLDIDLKQTNPIKKDGEKKSEPAHRNVSETKKPVLKESKS